MSGKYKDLIGELQVRGLIAQTTGDEELAQHLAEGSRTVYCGFDPTADSLHIGSLVPLLALRRFQMAGHKPIALVGGATGLIGDPSFKSEERKLNTPEVVAGWVEKLKIQMSAFIDFASAGNTAKIVNNLDWVGGMDVLSFLRDIGKHFPVNQMIKMESVRQRIEREGEGISFTEFAYMILQSLDFAQLYKTYGCTVQIGGSDQWGNITGGTELTRRLYGGKVFGLTLPLVTKADGSKFGKTESGTVWLDPKKTSPYAFYQFWLNTADADVYKFLRYFTFLDVEKIAEIEQADRSTAGRPQAQRILADELTRLIHGEKWLEAAQRITASLFSGDVDCLSLEDWKQLKMDGLPASNLSLAMTGDVPLTQLLATTGLGSGKQIKDALGQKAVFVNKMPVGLESNMNLRGVFAIDHAFCERYFLVRLGKKKYHLFELC